MRYHNCRRPKPAPVTAEIQKIADALPDSFDWRNVNGVNFVSPIRNQGSCGSCYAFGSMGMTEARLRLLSNNTVQTVYSTQDIVECSQYSQVIVLAAKQSIMFSLYNI
jgi:cathepsin C